MNIGEPKKVREIEPVDVPVPSDVPVEEPVVVPVPEEARRRRLRDEAGLAIALDTRPHGSIGGVVGFTMVRATGARLERGRVLGRGLGQGIAPKATKGRRFGSTSSPYPYGVR